MHCNGAHGAPYIYVKTMAKFSNKTILVTGACGTVGSQLIRSLLTSDDYSPDQVVGIDHNESELFFLDQAYIKEPRVSFFLADIRDRDVLVKSMQGVDIVFHSAALKHVILCERSPYESVQTNIMGVQNIICAAESNGVEKVIFTSSDKAVNPTNVMGTSKLMGERLMTAANSSARKFDTIFASTRFGNVLGSNGSVIPIFRQQIKSGGPVTLTDQAMTRFVMTIEESVRLVIDSALQAEGGEVFITKMPVIKIADLAEVMIDLLAPEFGYSPDEIQIEVIGSKPGEKMYEELMSQEETRRAVELPNYFAVLPAFRGIYRHTEYNYENLVTDQVTDPYVSEEAECLTKDQLRSFLIANVLLADEDEQRIMEARYWPGDKEERGE